MKSMIFIFKDAKFIGSGAQSAGESVYSGSLFEKKLGQPHDVPQLNYYPKDFRKVLMPTAA